MRHSAKEVSRQAKVTCSSNLEITEEARANQLKGLAIVTAVLCKTGKVTNIEVVKGFPYGMNEKLIEATGNVEFVPAEKDAQVVSQRARFEYSVSGF